MSLRIEEKLQLSPSVDPAGLGLLIIEDAIDAVELEEDSGKDF